MVKAIGSAACAPCCDCSSAGLMETAPPARAGDSWRPRMMRTCRSTTAPTDAPGQGEQRFARLSAAAGCARLCGRHRVAPFDYVPDGPALRACDWLYPWDFEALQSN